MEEASSVDQKILLDLITEVMPFGKYKGTTLCNIPEYYLVWLQQKGFPKGRLGMQLSTLYEIKLNGLEYLLTTLKNKQQRT